MINIATRRDATNLVAVQRRVVAALPRIFISNVQSPRHPRLARSTRAFSRIYGCDCQSSSSALRFVGFAASFSFLPRKKIRWNGYDVRDHSSRRTDESSVLRRNLAQKPCAIFVNFDSSKFRGAINRQKVETRFGLSLSPNRGKDVRVMAENIAGSRREIRLFDTRRNNVIIGFTRTRTMSTIERGKSKGG